MITALIAVVVGIIIWIRIDGLKASQRQTIRRLAATCGYGMGTHYDGSVYFYVNDYNNCSPSTREFTRLQEQFSLFLKDAGYKFVPQKTEEVHQGDKHEVKVTPAKFVKSKSRS